MDKTIEYYNTHASAFVQDTQSVNFNDVQQRFLSHLKKGDRILDLGCGSGRDSAAFLSQGFEVEAMDASEKMCQIASEYTGLDVKNKSFLQLDAHEEYEGIWACASLLHAPKEQLPELFEKIKEALKPFGIFYCSFKEGNFEGERNGRYFSDMHEDELKQLITCSKLECIDFWKSSDVRKERTQIWLNAVCIKPKA
jgi:2-polyprenyl-3-methyl-5-hydroxy-6-metoxy-1,4-benzoquinol methylase